jgi:FdhD protein
MNKFLVRLMRTKVKRKVTREENVTIKRGILKVNLEKDIIEHVEDEVASEQYLKLNVNNKPFATFICSPTKTKELVVGNLLTQGIISRPEEIKRLQIQKEKANVRLERETMVHLHVKKKTKRPEASQDFIINPEIILNVVSVLDMKAVVYRKTGGTHAAALLNDKGDVLVFSEDISRHNAVDKVIGEAILKHLNLKNTILASTGRLSSEIVMKAAKVGIQVIVSVASPTDKGIDVAEREGLTLIGFARGKRYNIYTHPKRIGKPSGSSKS